MITISGENVFKLYSVPHDWKTCLLDEAVKIQGGSQPPKKVFRSELEEGYVRLVQIRDYKSDRYLTYVPENSTKKFCTKDDIMIGRYGPPVFQILRGIAGAYNVALMKAIPLFNMDRNFLFHLLSSPPVQNLVIKNSQRTAGQTGVNLKLLNSCIIPLPPLDQQKKIADILDAADAYRQKTKTLIEKYDELTQSLFIDMFGDPVSNPKGWQIKSLDNVSLLTTKGSSPKWQGYEYISEGVRFITSENVRLGHLDISKDKFVASEFHGKLLRSQLKENDLLVNLVGASIGRGALVTNDALPANINQAVAKTELDLTKVHPLFILYQVVSPQVQERLIGNKVEGARANISLKNVREMELYIPPISLQNQFAERVQAIEEQKAQAEASLAQAEDLFNSLLQRAFKGELTS